MIKATNKSLDGTSFHGNTISATLADLMNVLGAPHGIGEQNDKRPADTVADDLQCRNAM